MVLLVRDDCLLSGVVVAPKAFPGMGESTALSRSFAEQGVKIRIRKETRPLL